MDEKTEELRDIFLDVADDDSVTESQEDDRGSLTDSGGSVDERLGAVLATLREKFGFETSLSTDQRRTLIRQFYDGVPDDELASVLETDTETVFRARMELHLVREDEPPLEEAAVQTIRDNPDREAAELATDLGTAVEMVERTRSVLSTEDRCRRVSQRFRTEYEEILTDSALTSQFAADAQDDGLDEATEGAETDVDF